MDRRSFSSYANEQTVKQEIGLVEHFALCLETPLKSSTDPIMLSASTHVARKKRLNGSSDQVPFSDSIVLGCQPRGFSHHVFFFNGLTYSA